MEQTSADASKKREREDDDDEEEIDEAKQKELDDAFLKACYKGSMDDVKRTLRAGASNTAQDKNGNSALIYACMREKYGRRNFGDCEVSFEQTMPCWGPKQEWTECSSYCSSSFFSRSDEAFVVQRAAFVSSQND